MAEALTEAFQRHHLTGAAVLHAAAFRGAPWNEAWSPTASVQRLQEIFETPRFLGFIMRDIKTGKAVALAVGSFESWHDGPHFQIKEVCVHPTMQRNGLGSSIFQTLMNEAFGRGATQVYLHTLRGSGAESLYRKLGFAELSGAQFMHLR